jgi:hypothetical protein
MKWSGTDGHHNVVEGAAGSALAPVHVTIGIRRSPQQEANVDTCQLLHVKAIHRRLTVS